MGRAPQGRIVRGREVGDGQGQRGAGRGGGQPAEVVVMVVVVGGGGQVLPGEAHRAAAVAARIRKVKARSRQGQRTVRLQINLITTFKVNLTHKGTICNIFEDLIWFLLIWS